MTGEAVMAWKQDVDVSGALDNARDLARHADERGYRRIWDAERRNIRASPSNSERWRACFPVASNWGSVAYPEPTRTLSARCAVRPAEHFPQDVLKLQAFLAPAGLDQRIPAVPAAGT